jgi:hypothetical protein
MAPTAVQLVDAGLDTTSASVLAQSFELPTVSNMTTFVRADKVPNLRRHFQVLVERDVPGHDLDKTSFAVKTLDECADHCLALQGCDAFAVVRLPEDGHVGYGQCWAKRIPPAHRIPPQTPRPGLILALRNP